MAWIKTLLPSPENQAVADAMADAHAGYPEEYGGTRRGERRLPDAVQNESIVSSHSLIPEALRHAFATLGALLDPTLPLSRRQHEMIAATVSSINRCFY